MFLTRLDRMFDDFDYSLLYGLRPSYAGGTRHKEEKNKYVLEIDVPGLGKEDVKVSLTRNILRIAGSNKDRSVKLAYTMPKHVESKDIEASVENGVLAVKYPKQGKPKEVDEVTIRVS